ncbi:MAG: hypothetical protein IJ849_04570 [Selenomonadaceae bacterium]|nr:hypothetical protein [Selenomonadaceae bacterium]
MTALRQEANTLLDTMSEESLRLIVDILYVLQRHSTVNNKPIDFATYMGRGRKLFTSTAEIDNYLEESRRERF